MKLRLTLTLTVLIIGMGLAAEGQERFEDDGYTYEITGENTVSLVGYKEPLVHVPFLDPYSFLVDYGYFLCPPSEVDYNGNTYTVTSVSDGALKNYSMGYLRLPDSVVSIGKDVARNCICLMYVIIPDNVISIGDNAFANCPRLMNVVIGKSFQKAGSNIFANAFNSSGLTKGKKPLGIDNLRLIYKNPDSPTLPVGKRYDLDAIAELPQIQQDAEQFFIVCEENHYNSRAIDYALPIFIPSCKAADLPYYAWGTLNSLQDTPNSYDYSVAVFNEDNKPYDLSFQWNEDNMAKHDWQCHTLLDPYSFALEEVGGFDHYQVPIYVFSPTQACRVNIEVFGSQRAYELYLADVKTLSADNRKVASVVYYDLHGHAFARPQTGVNMMRTTYTDGSSTTVKVLVR